MDANLLDVDAKFLEDLLAEAKNTLEEISSQIKKADKLYILGSYISAVEQYYEAYERAKRVIGNYNNTAGSYLESLICNRQYKETLSELRKAKEQELGLEEMARIAQSLTLRGALGIAESVISEANEDIKKLNYTTALENIQFLNKFFFVPFFEVPEGMLSQDYLKALKSAQHYVMNDSNALSSRFSFPENQIDLPDSIRFSSNQVTELELLTLTKNLSQQLSIYREAAQTYLI